MGCLAATVRASLDQDVQLFLLPADTFPLLSMYADC